MVHGELLFQNQYRLLRHVHNFPAHGSGNFYVNFAVGFQPFQFSVRNQHKTPVWFPNHAFIIDGKYIRVVLLVVSIACILLLRVEIKNDRRMHESEKQGLKLRYKRYNKLSKEAKLEPKNTTEDRRTLA